MNDKITNIVNDLSNNEIAELLNHLTDRVDVYVGSIGRCMVSSPISHVTMNGSMIQVNLELAELDDLRENNMVARGLERAVEVKA